MRLTFNARVAKLADARGSGPRARKGVQVQVLSRAPVFERRRPFNFTILTLGPLFFTTFKVFVKNGQRGGKNPVPQNIIACKIFNKSG
jgi:hypothetical protein